MHLFLGVGRTRCSMGKHCDIARDLGVFTAAKPRWAPTIAMRKKYTQPPKHQRKKSDVTMRTKRSRNEAKSTGGNGIMAFCGYLISMTCEQKSTGSFGARPRLGPRRRRMNQDDQRRCDAWGREKERMNRMNQDRGRGVLVPLATAEGRRPAWRASGENFPWFRAHSCPQTTTKTRLAHRAHGLVVGCSLFINHNKKQNKETPLALTGVGTREERAP